MWIILNNSFLSIVQHDKRPSLLMVRARLKGDIERVFPAAKIHVDQGTDYKYRAFIPRDVVAKAMADQVTGIDYDNFKNSIRDARRKTFATRVWNAGWDMQEKHNPIWTRDSWREQPPLGEPLPLGRPVDTSNYAKRDDFEDINCEMCGGSGMIKRRGAPMTWCPACGGNGC